MRKQYMILGILLLAIIIVIGAWRLADNKEASQADFLMGTYIEIRASGRKAPAGLAKAFERIKEIEDRMTQYGTTSEVAVINQQAGKEPVVVSPDTFHVIEQALHYAELTGGKFDPTIQPLVDLWQIGSPQARVPTPAEIAAKLPAINYLDVILDSEQSSVLLKHVGMGLDLGGIAKGFAADEAVTILHQHGIKHALLNLGGNIFALGKSPAGRPWNIGIQDPLTEISQYVAVIGVSDETLVTSGAYERFLELDGALFHHILDPDTGYPAASELLSVTIIGDQSLDADALSTSIYILGLDAGLNLINSLPGFDAVLIDKQHQIFATSGVRARLEITDPQYRLMP